MTERGIKGANFKDLFLGRLRKQPILPVQTDDESLGFIIIMKMYPEVTIVPKPWLDLPDNGALADFLQGFHFREAGTPEKTDGGLKFYIDLEPMNDSRKRYRMHLRRWTHILASGAEKEKERQRLFTGTG